MPEEDMADMEGATLDFGGSLDAADDLITYDENEAIDWAKPTSGLTPSAMASAVDLSGNETGGELSDSHKELADVDFGLLKETAGELDAGGDEIDWDTHDDHTGKQPALIDEASAADEFGLATENGVGQLPDDEVLYDDTGVDDAFAGQDTADGDPLVAGDFGTDARGQDLDILAFEDTTAQLGHADQAAHGVSGLANEEFDEITYEDDDAAADGAASSSREISEIAAEDEVASGQDIATVSQGGDDLDGVDSAVDNSDSHDFDNQSEADGLAADKDVMVLDDDDEDDDEEGEDASSTPAIPAITVCYRSEEFPLFKGAPGAGQKMPFFSNLAPLEFTMDRLLASFRQELSDELGLNDEIVLQIDELGLEFSESTQRDSLVEVTLRQLLQIFDQLVKNQDPDSSRPLYTYVSTRPNPAKRLESLIEDAFAGKGLDEVVHYFHPSAHNATSDPVVGATAVDDKYPEDYESYEESDEAAEADQPVATNEGQDYDESEEDVDDGERSAASLSDDHLSGDGAHGAGSEVNDQHGDVEDVHTADQDAEQQRTDSHVAFDFTNEDDADGAATYNDFDDADQFFQPDDETYDDLATGDDDLQQAALEVGQDVLGADEASKVTSSTSASATLNGEDEIDFENDLNDPTSLAIAPETEVTDDIQWTEADDDHVEPSGTGKRPRDEDIDELGEGDENDVKRRRS